MNFVNNDNDHILYLENSFSTTTYDLVHLGIIQQLKKKRIKTSLESASCKMFKHGCSVREKKNTEFKSYLADGPVMSVWHLKGVLDGSCEWPGVNHTTTYKCIILKK